MYKRQVQNLIGYLVKLNHFLFRKLVPESIELIWESIMPVGLRCSSKANPVIQLYSNFLKGKRMLAAMVYIAFIKLAPNGKESFVTVLII